MRAERRCSYFQRLEYVWGRVSLDTARAAGVDIDSIDGTDINTEHAVDTLGLVRRFDFDFAFGVIWSVNPREDINRTILQASSVADADIVVDGNVGPVNTELFRRINWSPDINAVLLSDVFSVLFELWVYGHRYLD